MAQVSPANAFAEILRGRHGVETRSAVAYSERVDFIRGKDFARWVKAHPEQITLRVAKGKTPDEQVEELGSLLLRQGLLRRCERKFKKPPPGQARLIKFPRKLLYVVGPEAQKFSEEGFYAWTFDRPTSPWVYAFSALGALGVLLVCLFPMAPHWMKAGVVYFMAAILCLILGTLLLRGIVATVSWVGTGRAVWLLPNVLQDDVPFLELFSPLIAVVEPAAASSKSSWANHFLVRLAVGAALGGVGWVLYAHTPDKDHLRKGAGQVRDDIFDWFNIQDPSRFIAGGAAKANGTAAAEAAAEAAAPDTPPKENAGGATQQEEL